MNTSEIHNESSKIIPCDPPNNKQFKNLEGKTFHRLTVEKFVGRVDHIGYHRYHYQCRCICGTVKVLSDTEIRMGTKSCGCLIRDVLMERNYKHGMCDSTEYQSWSDMIKRCTNPNAAGWKHYGGRGIKVCERWKSFQNFLDDLGQKPTSKHTIDRYPNVNGDYEPSNTRWATKKEQGRNKRDNRLITVEGVTRCVSEWNEVMKLPYGTINNRLFYGWEEQESVTTPKIFKNRIIAIDGESHTASEWSGIKGMPRHCVGNRLAKGWLEHDAVMTPFDKPKADANKRRTQPATA